jgi:hypothetical protein
MADDEEEDDDDTPWSEKHWFEKIWIVVWAIAGGLFGLVIVAAVIMAAVNETRWTFTRVNPEHACTVGQSGDCLTRTRGVVTSGDDYGFTVAIDRAPYRREVTSLDNPGPPVGSRVVMEDWHGRLVSVVDSARGRRHTNQWPHPVKDALEALAAWAALLFIPVLFFVCWCLDWREKHRARATTTGSAVTEQPART